MRGGACEVRGTGRRGGGWRRAPQRVGEGGDEGEDEDEDMSTPTPRRRGRITIGNGALRCGGVGGGIGGVEPGVECGVVVSTGDMPSAWPGCQPALRRSSKPGPDVMAMWSNVSVRVGSGEVDAMAMTTGWLLASLRGDERRCSVCPLIDWLGLVSMRWDEI